MSQNWQGRWKNCLPRCISAWYERLIVRLEDLVLNPENVRRYISAADLAYINQHLDFCLLNEMGYKPCWSKPEISK